MRPGRRANPAISAPSYTLSLEMKRIALFAVFAVFVLLFTKIVNSPSPRQSPGSPFWLYGQQVVECTPTEITLMDHHHVETFMEKDGSWPDCASYRSDQLLDFHLYRDQKAHFLEEAPTPWWRKALL